MPSIIDMVSQAEAEALSLKKDAERQAKEMEAAARQKAQAQIQAAQEAGRNRVAAAIAEAEEEGKLSPKRYVTKRRPKQRLPASAPGKRCPRQWPIFWKG